MEILKDTPPDITHDHGSSDLVDHFVDDRATNGLDHLEDLNELIDDEG